jgi:cytochrome c553
MSSVRSLLCLLALAPIGAQAADAAPEKNATERKAEVCAACHGPHGQSTNPAWPSLAGQTARYLDLQLRDFKAGRRSDPLMSPIAKTLSAQDMQALAEYFSRQRAMSSNTTTNPAKVAQGRTIAADSLCTMCHLGGFSGQNEVPLVAGQQYRYVVKQLEDFRDGRRTNDAGTMQAYTKGLTDEQIDALAQFVTSLN